MPRRPRLAWTPALATVAALTTALALVGPVQGAAESVVRAAARAWQSVFGDRPAPAFEQRMLVVLAAPSLADRVSAAEGKASAEDQRQYAAFQAEMLRTHGDHVVESVAAIDAHIIRHRP